MQTIEEARAELARIDAEQTDKLDRARAVFDEAPTEKNAQALSVAERVAALMIGKAKDAVAELEEEARQARRAELRTELTNLKGKISHDTVNARIATLAAEEAAIRRKLFDARIALYGEIDSLRAARIRCDAIAEELAEPFGGCTSIESISNLDNTIGRVANSLLRKGISLGEVRNLNAIRVAEHP
jgi:hypothetical protein